MDSIVDKITELIKEMLKLRRMPKQLSRATDPIKRSAARRRPSVSVYP